ncbi:dihydrodipicolinate reductase [Nereida sp. MMG025]|uniref:dihydrodipicolinate reductase n=1 Tax=Nereida sp. MMG025 TaxID=2909981 RepID=UPI001F2616DE|nr:dihydrodipicolinate reductase [Nereida sp. MMG025]MCF6444843.1 dihydrodipicolinate reductase [Nereida sp. MMG025]
MTRLIALIFALSLPAAALADGFAKVADKNRFVSLVQNKQLHYPGIRLNVTPDGKIVGRALGREVTGGWSWQSGYFCREIFWGTREIGYNCQEVRVSGDKLRFTSDKGTGRYADLTLK